MMIDLHTHSIFSDGELIPYELVRRAEAIGYQAIAITDHVDFSNVSSVVPAIVKAVEKLKGHVTIEVIPGAEITHAPPSLIPELVKEARALGARLVVVHGETIAEPVLEGTNRAAIEAGADILAHPGLISEEDVRFAKERGVMLELTSRKGHCLSNGHVAGEAMRLGAAVLINTDAHGPGDLITKEAARKVLSEDMDKGRSYRIDIRKLEVSCRESVKGELMPKAIKKKVPKPVMKEEEVTHILQSATHYLRRQRFFMPLLTGLIIVAFGAAGFSIYRSHVQKKAEASSTRHTGSFTESSRCSL